ncbi:hypothetical protein IKG64_03200 [Candidatus Saccharibacteria bacterium]|nr:hypothetical protein [Candidatus Saccharibacteria bacterium]
MTGIKTKFRRLNYKLRHDFFAIENVVLMLSIILCLMWTYQSITAMSRNWELSEKLTTERKEFELLSVEVEAAELENTYYQTTEYQELMARKHLDKQWPGEQMVVLPDNSDAAKSKHQSTAIKQQEKQYSNFEKWMMYLFPSH